MAKRPTVAGSPLVCSRCGAAHPDSIRARERVGWVEMWNCYRPPLVCHYCAACWPAVVEEHARPGACATCLMLG